ncbi:MAG: DMT family transporter [Planctomycetaceae bacterium]|nr:DMT family transporter [Planctomycetaceae bacterium]
MSDLKSPSRSLSLTAILLASLIAILWGLNSVAVRYSVDELPPVFVAGLRFLIGAVFMIGWCRWEGSRLQLHKTDILPCAIVGVLLFVQISLFNAGVEWSTASHGSLYVNTFVFWVIAIEHFITKADRLTPRKILGLCLAAGSVVLLIGATDRSHGPQVERDVPTLRGDLILCLSAFFLGVKIVATKLSLKTVSPGTLIFWQSLIGTALFFAWSLAFEEIAWRETTWPTWVSVLYQGTIVAGLCFAVQARLMQTYSASQISVFAFITPLSGVAAGVWMRDDRMSSWLLLAAIGIAAGIYFVNRPEAKPSQSAEETLGEERSGTGTEID